MIDRDDDRNAVSCPQTAPEMEPCLEEHFSLVYRARARRPSSVKHFFAKNRKRFSSMITNGCQSRKLMRGVGNKRGLGAGLRPSSKAEDLIGVIPAESDALRLKAGFVYQVLKVVIKYYCFVCDAAFNEFEDLFWMETCCSLSRKVSRVLARLPIQHLQ